MSEQANSPMLLKNAMSRRKVFWTERTDSSRIIEKSNQNNVVWGEMRKRVEITKAVPQISAKQATGSKKIREDRGQLVF